MQRRDVLFRFALRFVLFFLPLSALWMVVSPFYIQGIFTAVNVAFQLDHPSVARVGQTEGALYAYQITTAGPSPAFEFEKYGLFFNMIVLMSLLLATPELTWLSRIRRVALGGVLLAAAHVLFIVFQVKAKFVNMGLLSVSEPTAYGLNWLAVLFGTLGEGLFPLLIAGALSWRAWTRALDLKWLPESSWVHRNSPCPCGSGKKYKYCCGKA